MASYIVSVAFLMMMLAPGVKPDSTSTVPAPLTVNRTAVAAVGQQLAANALQTIGTARAASFNRWLPHKDPASGMWLPPTSQAATQQQILSSLTLWDLPDPLYWLSLKGSPYPLPTIVWPTLAANTIKGLVAVPAAMATAIVAAPAAVGFFGFILLAFDDSGELQAIPWIKALTMAISLPGNIINAIQSSTDQLSTAINSIKGVQSIQATWSWLYSLLSAVGSGRAWSMIQQLFSPGTSTAGRRMLATTAGASATNSTTTSGSISAEAQAFLNLLKTQPRSTTNATAVVQNPVKLMCDALVKLSTAVLQQSAAKDAQLKSKVQTVAGILTKVVSNIMSAAKINVLQGTHPNDVDLIAGLAAIPAQLPLLANALTVLQPVPPPAIHLNMTGFLEAGKTLLNNMG